MKISNNVSLNEKILTKLALGPMPFYDFMEIALYDPLGGFYCKEHSQFGKEGAFITSHYHAKWLGAIIANQIKIIFKKMMSPDDFKIIEYGPGEGFLAHDILKTLESDKIPIDFFLIEKSNHLVKKSKDLLSSFEHDISFVKTPPENFEGIILAHEFIDALPFHILQKTENGFEEKHIVLESNKLKYELGPVSKPSLIEYSKEIDSYLRLGQTFEVCLDAEFWIEQISKKLKKGAVLIFDYGFSNKVIFDQTRFSGTARSFRKHTVSEVNLENIGESDITADVNFSYIVKSAEKFGFTLGGFTDQTHFCIGGRIAELIHEENIFNSEMNRKGIMGLVNPTGLGSGIKVLLLSKGLDLTGLDAFSMKPDDRASLNTLRD
ncbi:MAG: SAM-dependent methyltransferase [Nitrospinota bacterium]|nr:SAM-dependent methyltransferase [Nitrospinota bacterium]